MQSGKSAMASAKQKAEDAAASTKAGMEKTKASVEEKGEKMTTRDPAMKAAAEERKLETKDEAEAEKRAAKEMHAEERATTGTGTGVAGYPSGQTGAVPGTRHHPHTGAHGSTTGSTF